VETYHLSDLVALNLSNGAIFKKEKKKLGGSEVLAPSAGVCGKHNRRNRKYKSHKSRLNFFVKLNGKLCVIVYA